MAAKDTKFAEVDEAIVNAALAGSIKFDSNSSVQLRVLDNIQLCRLLHHCYIFDLDDFILRNQLTGKAICLILDLFCGQTFIYLFLFLC